MSDESDPRARLQARDSGLRRLKALTGVLAVGSTVLAGIVAGLAAETAAGRKLIGVTAQPRASGSAAKPDSSRHRSTRIPAPPPLPPAGSDSTPALAAPAQPPAPVPAPPVVVSGGS